MIEIRADRCTGCGECVPVCPAGALSIQEGRALVDQALCRGCEACVAACPLGAVILAAPVAVVEPRQPQPRPATVIDVPRPNTAHVPRLRRILPGLAGVISFAARELVPPVLEALAAMPREPEPAGQAPSAPGVGRSCAGGQRARQRHRGRHGWD